MAPKTDIHSLRMMAAVQFLYVSMVAGSHSPFSSDDPLLENIPKTKHSNRKPSKVSKDVPETRGDTVKDKWKTNRLFSCMKDYLYRKQSPKKGDDTSKAPPSSDESYVNIRWIFRIPFQSMIKKMGRFFDVAGHAILYQYNATGHAHCGKIWIRVVRINNRVAARVEVTKVNDGQHEYCDVKLKLVEDRTVTGRIVKLMCPEKEETDRKLAFRTFADDIKCLVMYSFPEQAEELSCNY